LGDNDDDEAAMSDPHVTHDEHRAHSHSLQHGRRPWQAGTTGEQVMWLVVAAAAVLTVVGLVALWPRGDLLDRADELGVRSERYKAAVSAVVDETCSYADASNPLQCRLLTVRPSQGPDAGTDVYLGEFNLGDPFLPDFAVGDRIVVGYEAATDTYFYADLERRPVLLWLFVAFVGAVIALAGWRGLLAVGALLVSLVVVVAFVVPSLLHGNEPVLVAVVGSAAIALVALYVTHGLHHLTTVAVLGTLAALAITLVLAVVFFEWARFSGAATEEATFLPLLSDRIDVSGLLLGGVIIGALGALDDVVVTQVATVAELRHADPSLGVRDLYRAAMRVGRQHTGSIVNTLLLAYAGASMPLLVLFVLSGNSLGSVANSEVVAVEIVRTLVGSIGLLAAVPISTWLAASLSPREPAAAHA
jgi:uncharacterized membrane protein